jgi:hypothetical protein
VSRGRRTLPETGPTTLDAGLGAYHEVRRGRLLKETALAYDPKTGIYHVIPGAGDFINIKELREMGLILLRHSHPNVRGADHVAPGDTYPSTDDMGHLALDTPPGEFRMATVDFELGGGRTGHTNYRVDKRNNRIECSIEIYHDGQLVHRDGWPDILDYQQFLFDNFQHTGDLPEGSTQLDPNALDDDY